MNFKIKFNLLVIFLNKKLSTQGYWIIKNSDPAEGNWEKVITTFLLKLESDNSG